MSAFTPIHNGLFSPLESRSGMLYWLRLYRLSDAHYVAVVTDVPPHRGPSAMNAASLISTAVAVQFAIDPPTLELFTVSPRSRDHGGGVQPAAYSRAPSASSLTWGTVSRRTIEGLVGSLPPMPDHESLFRQVMARGGRARETYRPIFAAVLTEELPPPHGPYQCAHNPRFQSMVSDSATEADRLAAGRAFIDSLTAVDLKRCRYHQGCDWKAVADASVEMMARLESPGEHDYEVVAREFGLPDGECHALMSLFGDPISLGDDRQWYTNGQHRSCAVRFSGARRVAVEVDIETTVHDDADWTYLGEG
jgi:hypothetical protein